MLAEYNPQCENCERRKVIEGIWEWVMSHCDHVAPGTFCMSCLLGAIKAAYDRKVIE